MKRADLICLLLQALIALILLSMCGCSSVWTTPTPPAVVPAETLTPTADPLATALPLGRDTTHYAATPQPQPTPELALLAVSDEPIQSWSDPNDVAAVRYALNSLWATTSGGVVRWRPDMTSYQRYTVADGLASQAVSGLAVDGDGHIWIGYLDRVAWSEFDGERWITYSDRANAVEARYAAMLAAPRFDPLLWCSRSNSDWLWLPDGEGGVLAYDGKWRSYGEREGITRRTRRVIVSDAGRVWAIGMGLSTAEEGERWWQDHSLFSDISSSDNVRDIAVDDEGVWLAFDGLAKGSGGLAYLHYERNRWTGYLHDLNEAIPRYVHGIEIDAQGTIWLNGQNGLAYQETGVLWRAVPFPDMLIQCYDRLPDGRLVVGTDHGLWLSNDATGVFDGPWVVPSPLVGNQVVALVRNADATLYVATDRGVTFVRPSGETGVLYSGAVHDLIAGSEGAIWVATPQGLLMARDRSHGADPETEWMLDEGILTMVFDAQGTLWACTQDGRLLSRQNDHWRDRANLVDLAGAPPRDLVIDREGTVWFATSRGVGSLTAEGAFSLATGDDRLLTDDVRALALGPDDEVWLATAKGLVRHLPSGRWTRFTTESTEGGLRAMEIHHVATEPSGTLWMCTAEGISRRLPNTDWAYLDLKGVTCVLPVSEDLLWVGTVGGLYRVETSTLTLIPEN